MVLPDLNGTLETLILSFNSNNFYIESKKCAGHFCRDTVNENIEFKETKFIFE